MMRIPGLRGFAGGDALASEAAVYRQRCALDEAQYVVPIPFGSLLLLSATERGLEGLVVSFTRVAVDEDDERLKVLVTPRWVSLSSEVRSACALATT